MSVLSACCLHTGRTRSCWFTWQKRRCRLDVRKSLLNVSYVWRNLVLDTWGGRWRLHHCPRPLSLSEAIVTRSVLSWARWVFHVFCAFFPPPCNPWIYGRQLIQLSLPLNFGRELFAPAAVCLSGSPLRSGVMGSAGEVVPSVLLSWTGPGGKTGIIHVSWFHPSWGDDTSWGSFCLISIVESGFWSHVLMEDWEYVCTTQVAFPPHPNLYNPDNKKYS